MTDDVTCARATVEKLWRVARLDPAALDHLTLTSAEPVLPSSFAVGTAMQASVAASALAAAQCWREGRGETQQVTVDMRATAMAMIKILVRHHGKTGRLFTVERAAPLPLTPRFAQLHGAPDQPRKHCPRAHLIQKGRRQTHTLKLSAKA